MNWLEFGGQGYCDLLNTFFTYYSMIRMLIMTKNCADSYGFVAGLNVCEVSMNICNNVHIHIIVVYKVWDFVIIEPQVFVVAPCVSPLLITIYFESEQT